MLELAQQLAPTAAQLLGAPKLRLYQDCTFLKNAGIGAVRYKHWHSRSLQRGFHETRRRSQPVLSCASGLQTPLVASIALYACTGFKCAGPAPEASLMTCTSRLSAQHFVSAASKAMPPYEAVSRCKAWPRLIQSKPSGHAGFSETNWHSDLRMAPFDTSAALTAWIPLTPIQVCTSRTFVF